MRVGHTTGSPGFTGASSQEVRRAVSDDTCYFSFIIPLFFLVITTALIVVPCSAALYRCFKRKWRLITERDSHRLFPLTTPFFSNSAVPDAPGIDPVLIQIKDEERRIAELESLKKFIATKPDLSTAIKEAMMRNRAWIADMPQPLPDGDDVYEHLRCLARRRVILESEQRELVYFLENDLILRKFFVDFYTQASPNGKIMLIKLIGTRANCFHEIEDR